MTKRAVASKRTTGPSVSTPKNRSRKLDPPQAPDSLTGTVWFYLDGSERIGPLGFEAFIARLEKGGVSGTTLVWREPMKDWAPAGELEELAGWLHG